MKTILKMMVATVAGLYAYQFIQSVNTKEN